LSVATALAFFFVIWGVLDDVDDMRAPWQTAGVSASVLLIGAVLLRELVLRRSRAVAYVRQPTSFGATDRHKLTVERAAAILGDIRRKSEAANVLDKIASGHREVFEMCTAFLQRIDRELPNVQAGSPRLAALLKSRTIASDLHHFHTLRWAEIEARSLTADAHNLPEPPQRIRSAQEAVSVVDKALTAYPGEESLLESHAILTELAVSIRVANAVEDAERAAMNQNFDEARKLYRDALFYLGRGDVHSAERERAAERINEAMDRLPFLDVSR
jgi:hypothetical protein